MLFFNRNEQDLQHFERDYISDKFPDCDVKIKVGIYNIEDNSFYILGD